MKSSLRGTNDLKAARKTRTVVSIAHPPHDPNLTLLDYFPALIWRANTEAKCDYFNRSWLEFTGRRLEQEKGDGWARGVHPEDLKGCLSHFRKAFNARQPFVMEYRLRRADGAYRWILDCGRPIKDPTGQFTGYIGSCFDITERKQAEASLDLFRALVDKSSDGLEVIDPQTGRFLDVNETTCQRLGYQREELLTMRVPDIEAEAVNFAFWGKKIEEIRAAGTQTFEGRHRRKNGSTFPVEVSVRYLRMDRDYLIAAVRDITKRKQSERELKGSHAQLLALSARLQAAREEEKSRFLREIHNTLWQTLTNLTRDVTWMQRKLEAQKNARLRAQLQLRLEAMAAALKTTTRSLDDKNLKVLIATDHKRLSGREHQIMLLLSSGKPLKEIAAELGISIQTVSTHRTRILKKLELHTTADLIRYLLEHGLID